MPVLFCSSPMFSDKRAFANAGIEKRSRYELSSYQLNMLLQRVLNLSNGDPDIPLCNSGGAVLQELLDQNYVIVIVLVNLRSEELSERVCPYILISQIPADVSGQLSR